MITQTKKRHSLRRLHARTAELRRKRNSALKLSGGRGRPALPRHSARRRAIVRETVAQASRRRIPTRQELQIEEEFEQAARELGLR
ncbi:MAG: hypothetical protein AB1752_03930 [Candidatus Zixiibacteriota bacterium]